MSGQGRGHHVRKLSPAGRVAREMGVSTRTIRRACRFAKAVDKLVATIAPNLERDIWANTAPSMKLINAAAEAVDADPGGAALILAGKAPALCRPRFTIDAARVDELVRLAMLCRASIADEDEPDTMQEVAARVAMLCDHIAKHFMRRKGRR